MGSLCQRDAAAGMRASTGERGLQAERTGRGWGELGRSGAEARAGRAGERKKRAGRGVRLLGRWERRGELGPGKEMGHGVWVRFEFWVFGLGPRGLGFLFLIPSNLFLQQTNKV